MGKSICNVETTGITECFSKPPYYVCRVSDQKGRQSHGIISLINYRYFREKIIPHEKVSSDKVEMYVRELKENNKLINPIILFYKQSNNINSIIEKAVKSKPDWNFCKKNAFYQIWKLNDHSICLLLGQYLADISRFYIADGHHRASALNIAFDQKNPFYLSYILHEKELQLSKNDRFFDIRDIDEDKILNKIKKRFILKPIESRFDNCSLNNTCLYLKRHWYEILPRDFLESADPYTVSSHLEDIVADVQKGTHSDFNEKVCYIAGKDSVVEIEHICRSRGFGLCLCLPSITFQDLYETTESSSLFPLHSTYLGPKLPNNLFCQDLKKSDVRVCL